jgi:hypothetical protein
MLYAMLLTSLAHGISKLVRTPSVYEVAVTSLLVSKGLVEL